MRDRNQDPASNTLAKFGTDIATVLDSLANRRRLRLLSSLLGKPQTISNLGEVTSLGKTALANHLGILVKAGLLRRIARGRYELTSDGRDLLHSITVAYATSRRR